MEINQSKFLAQPTRRTVVKGLGAAALAAAAPVTLGAAAAPATVLRAQTGIAQLLEEGQPRTDIWGFGGTAPGPLLRVAQGETVNARLDNAIDQPTTVHWHGIRIDNAMDGVAGLTQKAVPPGAGFDYRFSAPDAGTYWYHPHNMSSEQVARGLHGLLIVTEEKPPAADRDIPLVFDDWRIGEDGAIHPSFGAVHDRAHAGRLGNVATLNGKPSFDVDCLAGERLRLRLVNVANARVLRIAIPGHALKVIALDGQPVEPFTAADGVELAPAQRADVMVDLAGEPGERAALMVTTGRIEVTLGHLVYHATRRARAKPLTDPIALPANPLATAIDADGGRHVDLVMTGGAMSPFEGAVYKGERLDIRTLVRKHGLVWAFNGIAAMPEKPLFTARKGETVSVNMVNETAWPHGMHFHGHHVREVAHSGRKPLPHWRDTVLLEPDETIKVSFIADNPGKWMLHCHMLEHQAGGMSTWFEVEA